MSKDVWIGLHVCQEGVNFEEMKQICLMAEKHKFDLLTVIDHFISEFEGIRYNPLECWTTLAGLAAVTNSIKLGPLVSCYAYRRPTVLAKMATTVDIISGGRLIFGLGAGSSFNYQVKEFKSYIGTFPPVRERLRGLEESIEICKRMFTNERTTYHGRFYTIENVLNVPQPIQRPVPILIGGGGEKRTLKIVAKHADISHVGFAAARNLKTLETKLFALKRHCKTVGRDYDEIRKGAGFIVMLGRTEVEAEAKLKRFCEAIGVPLNSSSELTRFRALARCGTSEKIADTLKDYIDKGLGFITCTFFNFDHRYKRDIHAEIEDTQMFSEEVIPQLI